MTATPRYVGLLLVASAALLWSAAPAWCGDDDKAPAYMIYIDPETGKYTTEDPGAATSAETVVVPPPSSQGSQATNARSSLLIAGAVILVVLLAAGIIRQQRKPIS